MVYFTSDLHIGHRSICKYRTRFKSAEEHHQYMLDKISELSKRDLLYIIGDFLFNSVDYPKHIEQLKRMPCRIKLVMGNHDSLKLYKELRFEMQLPLFSYKNKWISHAPIHPLELRERMGNIHGHLHGNNIPDGRYFNVNIENNQYEFVSLDTIKEYFTENYEKEIK